mmetsp:Transcript_14763/g.36712  ORF Transcript_14763/g.36712 Transcript_14763/m.36712 type:complete len:650 (+) Transcript_14763:38-1987(+)
MPRRSGLALPRLCWTTMPTHPSLNFLASSPTAASPSSAPWLGKKVPEYGTAIVSLDDPLLAQMNNAKSMGIKKWGMEVLHDPWYTKGTAFTAAERDRLGLRGLLPPRVVPFEKQVERIMNEYEEGFPEQRKHESPEIITKSGVTPEMIRKFDVLQALQNRNETLFYRVLLDNFKQMVPIIYTPTVGWACQHYAEIFRRPKGMYFSAQDRGEMAAMCANWPAEEVDAIVVTDGSRILGLGDLGVSGMGISVGKLNCYVVAAGFHPHRVLPVCLDVGTNNEKFLKDPMYLGLQHKRLEGEDYLNIVDEFLAAVTARWPGVLVQFEDFSHRNALSLLERYRRHRLVFNDDVQGTAATVLAGVYGALAVQHRPASDITKLRFCCAGAGSAGTGVITLIHRAMVKHGLSEEDAWHNFWVCDVGGLITRARAPEPGVVRLGFARPEEELEGLALDEAVRRARPSVLLGLSGIGQLFTAELMRHVAESASAAGFRPLIFPLSNPTSNSETTPQQAQEATGGQAIVATGSPFPDVEFEGRPCKSNQGNNVYIFPGLALGAVLSKTPIVTDSMIFAASEALAAMIPQEALERGQCFPDLEDPRAISARVALAVIVQAAAEGLAQGPVLDALDSGKDALMGHIARSMYYPEYVHFYKLP